MKSKLAILFSILLPVCTFASEMDDLLRDIRKNGMSTEYHYYLVSALYANQNAFTDVGITLHSKTEDTRSYVIKGGYAESATELMVTLDIKAETIWSNAWGSASVSDVFNKEIEN